MTIKQQGGVFGRNPNFNDVEVDGTLSTDQISENTLGSGVTIDGVTLHDASVLMNGYTVSAIQVTIADDAVASISFKNRLFGVLIVTEGSNNDAFSTGGSTYVGYVDFGSTPASSNILVGAQTEVNNLVPLTGTTGTDGRLVVGTAAGNGTLQLENRAGGTRTFNVVLL